jgi:hypothetical protein
MSRVGPWAFLFLGVATAPALAQTSDLKPALGVPSWLAFRGEARMRAEALTGQFRAGAAGNDHLLLFRTLFLTEASIGPTAFGVELLDGRTYFADGNTPLGTSLVNPLDVLQAYLRLGATAGTGPGAWAELKVGRQTLGIGSQRHFERVEFSNAIQNYTGVMVTAGSRSAGDWQAWAVVPVGTEPSDREAQRRNTLDADREQWGRRIWGLYHRRAQLPLPVAGLGAEATVFSLQESDRPDAPTPNRRYLTSGIRLYRAPKAGRWDLDMEGAYRFGKRRETSASSDTTDLAVKASMLFATLGYTLPGHLRLRLVGELYWASGDRRPTDGRFDQFERLFGSSRTDLNNTSIHGPLTPANLLAPAVRIEIAPTTRSDARLKYSAAHLASASDGWVNARLRDPAGGSGRFIGHAFDGRGRVWLLPDRLRLELGGSALLYGRFPRSVAGGPEGSRTLYGYSQVTLSF